MNIVGNLITTSVLNHWKLGRQRKIGYLIANMCTFVIFLYRFFSHISKQFTPSLILN